MGFKQAVCIAVKLRVYGKAYVIAMPFFIGKQIAQPVPGFLLKPKQIF